MKLTGPVRTFHFQTLMYSAYRIDPMLSTRNSAIGIAMNR